MNINDENGLREQLHGAAPQPGDADFDELIRRGLHIARRRRSLLVGSTAAIAAAAIAFGGVTEFSNGGDPAKNAASPSTTLSQTKNARPSSTPSRPANLAPVNPACPDWQYQILLNGQQLPDTDTPLSLKAGETVNLQIQPGPGQLAVSAGTAQLVPAETGAGLTASDATALVNGTTNSAGAITYQLPLTTPTGGALPAGTYNLVLPYTTPCSADKADGGEIDITVNLA